MQRMVHLTCFLALFFITQGYSITLDTVGKCLGDLVTHEFSNSYNYLQLSSKFGTKDAYPGFSSLLIKLSDDDASKAHDITKFLVLRRIVVERLINQSGIGVHSNTKKAATVEQRLAQAIHHNAETWRLVRHCHQHAINANDANIQDYIESHILNHHVRIDKLLHDFQHRIDDSDIVDRELTIFMLDEELLHSYGDRRKDIF